MKKEVTIYVNTRPFVVEKDQLSFADVVVLAYETPPYGENTEYTVAYRKGHGNASGMLYEGGKSVKAQEGMIFDVTATNKS